jgi:hypothetical protein
LFPMMRLSRSKTAPLGSVENMLSLIFNLEKPHNMSATKQIREIKKTPFRLLKNSVIFRIKVPKRPENIYFV